MKVITDSILTVLPSQGQKFHCVVRSSSGSGELKGPYVMRYVVPYTNSKWEDWLTKFTLQTGCEYRICSQKQSNTQSRERGVMKVEGKLYTYFSAWSHAYSCLCGGVGQFKSLCIGKRNYFSIGTRRLECTAAMHI